MVENFQKKNDVDKQLLVNVDISSKIIDDWRKEILKFSLHFAEISFSRVELASFEVYYASIQDPFTYQESDVPPPHFIKKCFLS